MSLEEFKSRQGDMKKDFEGSQVGYSAAGSNYGQDAQVAAVTKDIDTVSKASSQISKPV